MHTHTFNILIEEGEDGYLLSEVLELTGCHTQAKSLDELMKRTREAISLYLECTKDIDVHERFVGIQQIKVKHNERITAARVRVVGDNIDNPGIYSIREALEIADQHELDLVEISPNADPPVCKVIDYQKFLYQQTALGIHQ